MLLEAMQYLMTPCDPRVRRLGYLKELIATEARAGRCRNAWRDHQEHTKSVIREAIAETPMRDRAVVLGGGLLLDIPLEELAAGFRQVDLVDVCFSRRTRAAARMVPNTTILELDLTGAVETLSNNTLQVDIGGTTDPERPTALNQLQSADLIVSANTLSQLPMIPLKVLKRRDGDVEDGSLDKFGQSLIQDHLTLLEGCSGTVCLITELERLTYQNGKVINCEPALFGLAPDLPGETWMWDIAPHPELFPDCDVRLRIGSAIWRKKPPVVNRLSSPSMGED